MQRRQIGTEQLHFTSQFFESDSHNLLPTPDLSALPLPKTITEVEQCLNDQTYIAEFMRVVNELYQWTRENGYGASNSRDAVKESITKFFTSYFTGENRYLGNNNDYNKYLFTLFNIGFTLLATHLDLVRNITDEKYSQIDKPRVVNIIGNYLLEFDKCGPGVVTHIIMAHEQISGMFDVKNEFKHLRTTYACQFLTEFFKEHRFFTNGHYEYYLYEGNEIHLINAVIDECPELNFSQSDDPYSKDFPAWLVRNLTFALKEELSHSFAKLFNYIYEQKVVPSLALYEKNPGNSQFRNDLFKALNLFGKDEKFSEAILLDADKLEEEFICELMPHASNLIFFSFLKRLIKSGYLSYLPGLPTTHPLPASPTIEDIAATINLIEIHEPSMEKAHDDTSMDMIISMLKDYPFPFRFARCEGLTFYSYLLEKLMSPTTAEKQQTLAEIIKLIQALNSEQRINILQTCCTHISKSSLSLTHEQAKCFLDFSVAVLAEELSEPQSKQLSIWLIVETMPAACAEHICNWQLFRDNIVSAYPLDTMAKLKRVLELPPLIAQEYIKLTFEAYKFETLKALFVASAHLQLEQAARLFAYIGETRINAIFDEQDPRSHITHETLRNCLMHCNIHQVTLLGKYFKRFFDADIQNNELDYATLPLDKFIALLNSIGNPWLNIYAESSLDSVLYQAFSVLNTADLPLLEQNTNRALVLDFLEKIDINTLTQRFDTMETFVNVLDRVNIGNGNIIINKLIHRLGIDFFMNLKDSKLERYAHLLKSLNGLDRESLAIIFHVLEKKTKKSLGNLTNVIIEKITKLPTAELQARFLKYITKKYPNEFKKMLTTKSHSLIEQLFKLHPASTNTPLMITAKTYPEIMEILGGVDNFTSLICNNPSNFCRYLTTPKYASTLFSLLPKENVMKIVASFGFIPFLEVFVAEFKTKFEKQESLVFFNDICAFHDITNSLPDEDINSENLIKLLDCRIRRDLKIDDGILSAYARRFFAKYDAFSAAQYLRYDSEHFMLLNALPNFVSAEWNKFLAVYLKDIQEPMSFYHQLQLFGIDKVFDFVTFHKHKTKTFIPDLSILVEIIKIAYVADRDNGAKGYLLAYLLKHGFLKNMVSDRNQYTIIAEHLSANDLHAFLNDIGEEYDPDNPETNKVKLLKIVQPNYVEELEAPEEAEEVKTDSSAHQFLSFFTQSSNEDNDDNNNNRTITNETQHNLKRTTEPEDVDANESPSEQKQTKKSRTQK